MSFEGEDERALALALNATAAAGMREARAIIERLGGLSALDGAATDVLRGLPGPPRFRAALLERGFDASAEEEVARAEEHGVSWALFGDPEYPAPLARLANPPIALYYRGRLPRPRRLVAVVGARKATRYGLEMAVRLGRELADRGCGVVSGLARGIDGAAHRGTLAKAGATWAILGCGLATVYPPEHVDLAEAIVENGGLVSEFSPRTPPLPGHFPRRNRIIAALCDAIVLVEGRKKSGGLITVRQAADLGREVFVVPGQVDNPLAEGVLSLIRDGVRVVRDARDLMIDMEWESEDRESTQSAPAEESASPLRLGRDEERVLAVLDHEARPLDELLADLVEPPGRVLQILLALELRGLVTQTPGLLFRRKPQGA